MRTFNEEHALGTLSGVVSVLVSRGWSRQRIHDEVEKTISEAQESDENDGEVEP